MFFEKKLIFALGAPAVESSENHEDEARRILKWNYDYVKDFCELVEDDGSVFDTCVELGREVDGTLKVAKLVNSARHFAILYDGGDGYEFDEEIFTRLAELFHGESGIQNYYVIDKASRLFYSYDEDRAGEYNDQKMGNEIDKEVFNIFADMILSDQTGNNGASRLVDLSYLYAEVKDPSNDREYQIIDMKMFDDLCQAFQYPAHIDLEMLRDLKARMNSYDKSLFDTFLSLAYKEYGREAVDGFLNGDKNKAEILSEEETRIVEVDEAVEPERSPEQEIPVVQEEIEAALEPEEIDQDGEALFEKEDRIMALMENESKGFQRFLRHLIRRELIEERDGEIDALKYFWERYGGDSFNFYDADEIISRYLDIYLGESKQAADFFVLDNHTELVNDMPVSPEALVKEPSLENIHNMSLVLERLISSTPENFISLDLNDKKVFDQLLTDLHADLSEGQKGVMLIKLQGYQNILRFVDKRKSLSPEEFNKFAGDVINFVYNYRLQHPVRLGESQLLDGSLVIVLKDQDFNNIYGEGFVEAVNVEGYSGAIICIRESDYDREGADLIKHEEIHILNRLIGFREREINYYLKLHEDYAKKGDYAKAFEYYFMYVRANVRDEILAYLKTPGIELNIDKIYAGITNFYEGSIVEYRDEVERSYSKGNIDEKSYIEAMKVYDLEHKKYRAILKKSLGTAASVLSGGLNHFYYMLLLASMERWDQLSDYLKQKYPDIKFKKKSLSKIKEVLYRLLIKLNLSSRS